MFDPKNRIHWVAAIIIALILILIFGVASTAAGQEPESWARPVGPDPGPCGAEPALVQRDAEPVLEDPAALREHLLSLQERDRPDAGGRTLLRVCVLATGHVGGVLVQDTSGDPVLDSVAIRVIASARYSPASSRGQPVTVWIVQPVDFVPRPEQVEL